jgi:hypothetical protein
MTSILFESEHLFVIHQQKAVTRTPVVFITFNGMSFRPGGEKFWGERFFKKLPFDVIGVVSRTSNWFPAEDMRAAAAAIRSVTPGACRIGYGFSQGGYAAIKFSAAIETRGVLAFCPQWSIDPSDVAAFDTRFVHYFVPGLDNGRKVVVDDIAGQGFLFFDPYHPMDSGHAAHLKALPGVEAVPCPFSGHSTLSLLTQSHESAAFLLKAAEMIEASRPPDEIKAQLRRRMRVARGSALLYASERSNVLASRGKIGHLAALRRKSPDSLSNVAYLRLGMHENDAAAVAKLTPRLSFKDVKTVGALELRRFVRKAGLADAELRLADLLIDGSRPAFIRLHAVQSYASLQLPHIARLALRDIVGEDVLAKPVLARMVFDLAQSLAMAEIARKARDAMTPPRDASRLPSPPRSARGDFLG